jgi:plastocyanin
MLPAAASAAGRVHTIVMAKMAFGAAPPELKRGDTIEWINEDIFRHTATASDGSFNVDLAAGARGRVELRKAGAITVRCRYHPTMTLRLTVGE